MIRFTIIVFLLTLIGIKTRKLADYFHKNIGKTKLALGTVFILLALMNQAG